MFKRSRKRIVAAIIASLVICLAVTLLVIYAASYSEIKRTSEDMLKRYTDGFSLEAQPGQHEFGDRRPPMDGRMPDKRAERAFDISTFYSVAFSKTGEILSVDNGNAPFESGETLIDLARKALESGESKGRVEDLMFITADRGDFVLVAMMDNAVTDNNLRSMVKYTLIAGAVSLAVIGVVAVFLARAIVRPLEENDKRQKAFVSDAGHELKTPVSVISTNIELLSRQVGGSEWLSNIQYENERMGTLVKQLLELSHAENAGLQKERIDFSRLVTGEALPFESVAFEKGLSLTGTAEEGVFVDGNRSQLCQLVSILLDNAIKHSSGGEITFSLKRTHRGATFAVENEGDEIPREKRELLFERFYRLDESRGAEGDHYGLGLAIAKAVCESHGGSISVDCRDGRIIFTATVKCV